MDTYLTYNGAYLNFNNKMLIGYKFEGVEFLFENNLQDTGNRQFATWSGTGPIYSAGKVNQCVKFYAGDSRMTYGNDYFIESIDKNFSFNFWIKMDSSIYPSYFLQVPDSSSDAGLLGQFVNPPNPGIGFLINNSIAPFIYAENYFDGNWHMISFINDADSSTYYTYYDNVLNSQMSSTAVIITDASLLKIGNVIGGPNSNGFFLDQFRYYARTITANDVSSLWNGGSGI